MDPFVEDNYPADSDDHNSRRRRPFNGESAINRYLRCLPYYHSLRRNGRRRRLESHDRRRFRPYRSLRSIRRLLSRQGELTPSDEILTIDGHDEYERLSDGEHDTFGLDDNSESSDSDAERSAYRRRRRAKRRRTKKGFHKQGREKPCKPARPIRRGAVYVVSVDGYFRKARSNRAAKGGYGVIIRRRGGGSIVAKTGCAAVARSGFFHTLQAVKKGLELAAEYPDITRLYVSCNADWVESIVNQCFTSGTTGSCRVHPVGTPSHDFDVFCATCLSYNVRADEFDDILDMMKVIVKLGMRYCSEDLVVNCERDRNKHADFLAKMQVEETVLQPHEFPSELKTLVAKMEKEGELVCYPD